MYCESSQRNAFLKRAAVAALPLAALAGCESSGLSPREASGRNFSSYVYSLYDAPAQAGDTQNAPLVLPSKLAVAQVGEVAPPTKFLDKLRARPELFSRVEGISGAAYLPPEPLRNTGEGDSSITVESRARREMERIRQAARDMGMDHLLLVGGTIDQMGQVRAGQGRHQQPGIAVRVKLVAKPGGGNGCRSEPVQSLRFTRDFAQGVDSLPFQI